MKHINDYRRKKVLVVGMARSGIAAAKLLFELGALVTVNDKKPFDEHPEATDLLERGIKLVMGSHPIELMNEVFEIIVKNPGIPHNNLIIEKAIELKLPIITEVELAYQISESSIIGITGTNGKTTTTTLIHEILNVTGDRSLLAGNIGIPASDVAIKARQDQIITMELSSFQLMGIQKFRPHIAVLTNIYEAHLDYHESRQAYIAAKMRITENQTADDFFVVNWNQSELRELSRQSKAKIIPFSTTEILKNGAYIKDNLLMFQDEVIGKCNIILLPGEHNVENVLAAICVAKLLNQSNEAIMTVLSTFKGVAHRIQFVREINRRYFYNDSKATNILSTEMALKGFEQPIILLAGGLDRGSEFSPLKPYLKNVRVIILFGETKYKIEQIAKEVGINQIHLVANVEEAVPLAFQLSQPGDIILLSPACASLDQYTSFENRGNLFIKSVEQLKD